MMTPNGISRFISGRMLVRAVMAIVCGSLVLATFRSVVGDWCDVPTRSMAPAIIEGDYIYLNKLAYDFKVPFTTRRMRTWSDPARGEVVVLYVSAMKAQLVKRVVAVPGDALELRDNRVYVNGTDVASLPDAPRLPAGRTIVPINKYVVMGDNRDHSLDSRYFGFVDRSGILGRVTGVIASLDPAHHSLPRPGRFCAPIQ